MLMPEICVCFCKAQGTSQQEKQINTPAQLADNITTIMPVEEDLV